jgi:TonB-linked SusC/RagA family outer membrane protein
MWSLLCLAVAGLALPLAAWAQAGSITGRVTDEAGTLPIVGARVQVIGTALSGQTLQDGRYTIANVPAGTYEVRVVAVGYSASKKTVTVTGSDRATVDFTLSAVEVSLEEIVITATGEQRKLELGHAITSVRADSLVMYNPITNVSSLLQGKAAGVAVLPSSGTTGTGTKIRIRGANSISLTNEPLIVIDGAYTDRGTNSLSIGTGGQAPSRLNDLNPEDIQSIEVVRGPSAATLYGGDAANGVIVVTTKRGKAGRTQWNAWLEQGLLQDKNDYPDNYRAFGHNVVGGVPQAAVVTCLLNNFARGLCTQDSMTTMNPLMDPKLTPIANGNRAQYGLSVTGGTEQVRYFVSGEYEDENGTFKLPDYEKARLLTTRSELDNWVERPNTLDKVSLRTNVNASLSSATEVGINIGYVSSQVRLPQNDNNVLGMLPSGFFGRANPSDTAAAGSCGAACGGNNGWGFYKPGEIFSLLREQGIERFTSSLQATSHPMTWLNLRGTVGWDMNNRTDYSFNPTGLGPPFSTDYTLGRLDDNRFQTHSLTVNLGADANAKLASSMNSRTTLGFQYVDNRSVNNTAAGRGLPAGTRTITGAATQFASSQDIRTKSMGVFLEEQLSINDRLFITGGLRADDASSIGKDYDLTLFPKASVSWLVSDEGFFPSGSFLNLFRLRAAYGESGLYPGYLDGLVYLSPTTAAINSISSSAVTIGGLGLSTLKPEHAREFEIGADFGFGGDRVSLEATFYNKKSRDALISRVLAPSHGIVTSRFENLGKVTNKGFELGVFTQPVRNSSITWDLNLTASFLKNNLDELGNIEGEDIPPIIFGDQRHVEGFPLGGYWTRPYTFADNNSDGMIDQTEIHMAPLDSVIDSDKVLGRKYMGNVLPTREASLSTSIGLFADKLRINARMDYVGGNMQYNNTEGFRCIATGNNCRAIMDPSAPLWEQARAVVRRFIDGSSQFGYIEKSDFAKLREVAVTYTVPNSWARAVKMSRLSLTAAGRNLLTITDYTGVDPELNSQGQAANFGTSDFLTQPPVRSFILRLNASF